MSPRRVPLSLLLILAACLILGAGRTAAQPNPSSDLLLPYFEVGALCEDVTTLFAVGNAAGRPVPVQATVYTNWGIPILSTQWDHCDCGVRTFNLRDWLVLGHLPDRDLTPEELAHVQAALSGQPSPRDGLYYATPMEAATGCAVGYVILRTHGFPRPDALWGDFFLVDPDLELAEGEALVNLDPSVDHRPLCRRHALRFLEGGVTESDTRLIIWTARQNLPSADPYYPEAGKVGCEMDCFDEPGNLLARHAMGMLPMEVMHVADLALPEPFGWIDVTTELESFITVRHAARGHFDVAIRTWCLPEEREEPPPEEDEADIDVEKLTNGHDADSPPGPSIPMGDPVVWEYVVTNTGDFPLTDVQVTDDQGVVVTCPDDSLEPGESMTCTASGVAVEGQYANLGTATGIPPEGPPVLDVDRSHYHGAGPPEPGIDVEKATNGQDADLPPGPMIPVGDPVTWTYVVTNTGGVPLTGIAVTDDQGVGITCSVTLLDPGESMTCTGHGTAVAGQYANLGTASGNPPEGPPVSDSDPSHYFGEVPEPPEPGIDIEKATNGQDADSPPGPTIPAGDPVLWTYVVTNTGNVTLTGITVVDNQGVVVTCPKSTLLPGESMTCTASGIAGLTTAMTRCLGHQYSNVGTAEGYPPTGAPVSDSDPSHYYWEEEEPPGDEGCTPGYWKNHTGSWALTGYTTSQSVESVFAQASAYPALGGATLLQALSFDGGPGVEGAAEILLRAGVAALLNAAHPDVSYPRTESGVVADVDTALASGHRDTMLLLAAALDAANNLGCPLN